jgi:hypothetical protein
VIKIKGIRENGKKKKKVVIRAEFCKGGTIGSYAVWKNYRLMVLLGCTSKHSRRASQEKSLLGIFFKYKF